MFPILSLPYVFRHRFHQLLPPATIFQMRQTSSQISRESFFIPFAVDKLYLNAMDSLAFIDDTGLLCQRMGFAELLNLKRCFATKEVFIDQLSTHQLQAISPCIDGIFSTLSLTGFPAFSDFKQLIKPGVKNLTFCGKIVDLPGLQEFFGMFDGMINLTLVQYCEATNVASVERIVNSFVTKNKETLKHFRYTLTFCNPNNSNSFGHLYATFDQNILKISVFGDYLQ